LIFYSAVFYFFELRNILFPLSLSQSFSEAKLGEGQDKGKIKNYKDI